MNSINNLTYMGWKKKIATAVRSISKIMGATVMCMALYACSHDETPGLKDNSRGFIEITLNVEEGTRSVTTSGGVSEDGTEPGTEQENTLDQVSLYFIDSSNSNVIFYCENITPEKDPSVTDGSKYKVRVEILPQSFATIFSGKKIQLYVVANSSVDLSDGSFSSATFAFREVMNYGSPEQYLPMSNMAASSELDYTSKTADQIKELFTSGNQNTLDLTLAGLGIMKLERIVARLDYKDAERGGETGMPQVENVYQFGTTGLYLKVAEMHPVNVNSGSYVFKHTSKGTTATANTSATMFGNEGPVAGGYSWVAGHDWVSSSEGFTKSPVMVSSTVPGMAPAYFTSGWKNLAGLTSTDLREDLGYHPVCYISENTIPSTSQMKEGVSTGVAFKTILCDEFGNAWKAGEEVPSGVAITTSANPALSFGSSSVALNTETDGSYSIVYFYWIRHDDNKLPNEMGPMEFAVVRNNIYKLSVKSFSGLPRPYNPGEDDEVGTAEITVDIKVQPWGYYKVEVEI